MKLLLNISYIDTVLYHLRLKYFILSIFFMLCLFSFSFVHAKIGENPETNLDRLSAFEIEMLDELSYSYKNTKFRYILRNDLVYKVTGEAVLDEEATIFMANLMNSIMSYGDEFKDSMVVYFAEDVKEYIGSDGNTDHIGEFTLEYVVSSVEVKSNDEGGESVYLPKIFFSLSYWEIPINYFQPPTYSMGPSDAKYVIREFSDFQCPACRAFAARGMPIVKKLVQAGDVRFEFHHYPLKSIHPLAVQAGEALECVMAINGPESFWSFHDTLFSQQSQWEILEDPVANFVNYARQNRLDITGLESCIRQHQYQAKVETAYQYALYLEIDSTPTIFINNFVMRPTLEENNRGAELGVYWFTFEDVFLERFAFSDLMAP